MNPIESRVERNLRISSRLDRWAPLGAIVVLAVMGLIIGFR